MALTDAPAAISDSFHVNSSIICINMLWFLSLTLALVSALFAILVQQWLREYKNYPVRLSLKERVCLRQLRYDSLNRWGIPTIISGISSMLQLALFLYLSGIVVLLWTIETLVAAVLTAVIGTFFASYAMTCLLPIFYTTCPYKSSLAWGISLVPRHVFSTMLFSIRPPLRFVWNISMGDVPQLSNIHRKILALFEISARLGRHEKWIDRELKELQTPPTKAVNWVAQILPYAQIDSITPLWSELSTNSQENFLMWLSWQIWGYCTDYAKMRPLLMSGLGHRAQIASRVHQSQTWRRTFKGLLQAALEQYCRDGLNTAGGYQPSTVVDMTRLATKNLWVNWEADDIDELRPIFWQTLSKTLSIALAMNPSISELSDLANMVLRQAKDGVKPSEFCLHCRRCGRCLAEQRLTQAL
jgi:hypothetical protein